MFLIGVDMWGSRAFDSKITSDTPNKLELSNGKYDEWKVDDGKIDYSDYRQEWGYSTVMLSTFDNTLEAGNMSNNGYEIEQLHFKRRKKDGLAWTTIAKMNYDPTQKYYLLTDRLVGVGDYEYCLVPVSGNIEGVETIKDISVEFDNMWVCTNDDSIRLIYDVEFGDLDLVSNTVEINTLESKYPFVFDTKSCYQRGNITASLYSEQSVMDREINRSSERQLRNNIMNELKKKKPRVVKTGDGKNVIVCLTNVREQYMYDTGTYGVSFDFTEIGDYEDSNDLERCGLMEVK